MITETIFAWPGIGRLLIQSIGFRDYPTVQGCVLLIAVTYVGVNLLTDLTYGFLDPRIQGGPTVIKVGAAIVLLAVVAALSGPWVVPYDPAARSSRCVSNGPACTIRSASTSWAAISSRACSPARASRCSSA